MIFVFCDFTATEEPLLSVRGSGLLLELRAAFFVGLLLRGSRHRRMGRLGTMSDAMTSEVVHSPGAVWDDGLERRPAVAQGKL